MTEIANTGNAGNNFTRITIKKGKGITHALLDLVKKQGMEISNGSISKAEWNDTIKTLDEIQQNRNANNQNSIFGKNYLVHEGQQIDFTENEINMLYKAMGVNFKEGEKPQTTPQSETPALNQEHQSVTVEQPQVPPSEQVITEQVEPESQHVDEQLQNVQEEAVEDKRPVSEYDLENGRSKRESEIGRTFVNNEDGSRTITYEYVTRGGKTVKDSETIIKNQDNTTTVLLDYDADGDIDASFTIDSNKRQLASSKFGYNHKKGLMSEEKTLFNKDGSYKTIEADTANGKEVHRKEFEYDQDGDSFSYSEFGENGQLIAREEDSYYPMGTIGEGRKLEKQTLIYDKDNKLERQIDYTYEKQPDGSYVKFMTITDIATGKVEVVRSD